MRFGFAPMLSGRLLWEPYGNPNHVTSTLTTHTALGTRAFSYTRGDLEVEGELISVTPSGASLELSRVDYAGVSVCTTGTYTLSPE